MIGSIAAVLTTFAFLPQVIKVIKTKDTESIALGMYLMQVLGIALWLAHGLAIQDLPLILANSVSFILSGIILVYKIRYKQLLRKHFRFDTEKGQMEIDSVFIYN